MIDSYDDLNAAIGEWEARHAHHLPDVRVDVACPTGRGSWVWRDYALHWREAGQMVRAASAPIACRLRLPEVLPLIYARAWEMGDTATAAVHAASAIRRLPR